MTTQSANPLYLGTMSGTSMDGLDIAAVSFSPDNVPLLEKQATIPYPQDLKTSLQSLVNNPDSTITELCELDTWLGQFYAETIKHFLTHNQVDQTRIAAIGSHGQTIRHRPEGRHPYTLQIGDPNIIAAQTGLTVIADFRRRDIALGGQGAPLVPAFHNQVFRSDHVNRAIINIGGIANITGLPANSDIAVSGFDSGPGNTLIDSTCRQLMNCDYDQNGEFARQGQIHSDLLETIMEKESFFQQLPPKSTATDYFSRHWMQQNGLAELDRYDQLATLTELTARTIASALTHLTYNVNECYICGGGAHNGFLLERLQQYLPDIPLSTTQQLGIDPDLVEAMAFAWLARQTLMRRAGNLPAVTNAEKLTILGSILYSNGNSELI